MIVLGVLCVKILILMTHPAPYRIIFFKELSKYVDLTVMYEAENYKGIDSREWNIDKNKKTYKEIYLTKSKKINGDFINSLGVLKIIDDSYDCVIVMAHGTLCSKIAIMYMRLLKMPYVLNIDGVLPYVMEKESKIKYFMKKIFYNGADMYITTGKQSVKYLEHYSINNKMIKFYHFTSVYDDDVLSKIITEEEKVIKKKLLNIDKKMILYVGRVISIKGIDALLNVAKLLSCNHDIEFYVIGGNTDDKYKHIIKNNYYKNIRFIPYMNKTALDKYYEAADVFFLPTEQDTWGLVINEAMAKGLPVVTTENCGAGMEMVENNKNGFIVKVNDALDMADKIKKIMENDELRENMKKYSLSIAKKFTLENMIQDHLKFFNISN